MRPNYAVIHLEFEKKWFSKNGAHFTKSEFDDICQLQLD